MSIKCDGKNEKKRKKQLRLLETPCHIGIAGGGLAGLSAALAILRGHRAASPSASGGSGDCDCGPQFRGKITIYERDASLSSRREGYGMTLTYDPRGPLARLGVLEDVASRDCPSRCHYVFDQEGGVRGYFGNAFHRHEGIGRSGARGAGQRGNLRIPRSELRSILLNTLMSEAAAQSRGDSDGSGAADDGGESMVKISWGKRLLSYDDRPMIEKLDLIRSSGSETVARDGPAKKSRRPVLLRFDDGLTDEVDLLIGADGVNSAVAKQYLSTGVSASGAKYSCMGEDCEGLSTIDACQLESRDCSNSSVPMEPQFLGIFIILGITEHFHPLIDERGFYTLDGTHRLFIMPFEGSRLDDDVSSTPSPMSNESEQTHMRRPRRRTMWQLSFPVPSEEDAAKLSRLSHEGMRAEVMRRCGKWHDPFPAMVEQTPSETIWGTSLVDRDPNVFLEHRALLEAHGRLPSRVVLLGDAAHPMTPFKGQGANRALADGPLLAGWLSRANPDSAVRGFMTEMVRGSVGKVLVSREAARKLHSEDCWDWMFEQDGVGAGAGAVVPTFHGVQAGQVPELLRALSERGVGPSLGSNLDETIRGVIREMGFADVLSSSANVSNGGEVSSQDTPDTPHLQAEALEHASLGNMSQLRQLSRKSHSIIPCALDKDRRTCLHLAAQSGHTDVCRWLLSEVDISSHEFDADGKSALDLAMAASKHETAQLLKRWIDQMNQSQCDQSKSLPGRVKPTTYMHGYRNSDRNSGGGLEEDLYRHVEQQLRGVRTVEQLCALLHSNRTKNDPRAVTHILGCHLDESDKEYNRKREKVLETEGAVLIRNFIHREVDRLALGVLALRPLNFDLASALGMLDGASNSHAGSKEASSKLQRKQIDKQVEELKSNLRLPSDADVVVQTNFGPQMQSCLNSSTKKRKIDSFPLSRLRYVNLGEWNYNWGDRRYEKVKNAQPMSRKLVALAQRAHSIAQQRTHQNQVESVLFDMAICNMYHLQRPSDRLGGHQDNVESNLSLPLVTVSLGAPGIFLLGGKSRKDVPTPILLRAGDCMVMGGKSRGYFHGVPTILLPELEDPGCVSSEGAGSFVVFQELDKQGAQSNRAMSEEPTCLVPTQDEMRFVKAFLRTVRMNMSIRQI